MAIAETGISLDTLIYNWDRRGNLFDKLDDTDYQTVINSLKNTDDWVRLQIQTKHPDQNENNAKTKTYLIRKVQNARLAAGAEFEVQHPSWVKRALAKFHLAGHLSSCLQTQLTTRFNETNITA